MILKSFARKMEGQLNLALCLLRYKIHFCLYLFPVRIQRRLTCRLVHQYPFQMILLLGNQMTVRYCIDYRGLICRQGQVHACLRIHGLRPDLRKLHRLRRIVEIRMDCNTFLLKEQLLEHNRYLPRKKASVEFKYHGHVAFSLLRSKLLFGCDLLSNRIPDGFAVCLIHQCP